MSILIVQLPEECPTCGESKKIYSTRFLASGGWLVMFYCGHFFRAEGHLKEWRRAK